MTIWVVGSVANNLSWRRDYALQAWLVLLFDISRNRLNRNFQTIDLSKFYPIFILSRQDAKDHVATWSNMSEKKKTDVGCSGPWKLKTSKVDFICQEIDSQPTLLCFWARSVVRLVAKKISSGVVDGSSLESLIFWSQLLTQPRPQFLGVD